MAKILCITLNSAYDLVAKLTELKIGQVNQLQDVKLYPAGKGWNTARVLSDLGETQLTVAGFYGAENNQLYLNLIAQHNWQNKMIAVDGYTRTNFKVNDAQQQTTDLNSQGYQVTKQQWQQLLDFAQQHFKDYDYIHLAGSLAPGITLDDYQSLLELTKSSKLIIDTSNQALKLAIAYQPYLIKPNLAELEELLNGVYPFDPQQLDQVIAAAKYLKDKYQIRNLLISMGEQGAIWLQDEQILQALVPPVSVVSTVGAGDSMVAGMIYGLSHNLPPTQTLALASGCGAIAVSQDNVGIYDPQLFAQLQQQTTIINL